MYNAIITPVRVRPHPTADRLQLGLVAGNQVVVGLDVEDGQLGIFFPSDGQLSEQYAAAHDLVGRVVDGVKTGGFFAANRRVRAQRFRGEKSDGYWAPLDTLAFTGVDLSTLTEGMEIDTANGVPICNKYYTPATRAAQAGRPGGRSSRKDTPAFPRHYDTSQFRQGAVQIQAGSKIIITEKEHGTSGRFGYVLDDVTDRFSFWQRVQRFLGGLGFAPTAEREEYRHLMGSRNVLLEPGIRDPRDPRGQTSDTFSGPEFRTNVVRPLVGQLHSGEILFYEIVGYEGIDAPIMSAHDVAALKDKTLRKTYGDRMVYAYGCANGTQRMRVYRITRALQGGGHVDLPWADVQRRCAELSLETVHEVTLPFLYDGDLKALTLMVEAYAEGPSLVDPTHIREGVVVRAESAALDPIVLKQKSYDFGLLEGYLKERDDFVDTEEIA